MDNNLFRNVERLDQLAKSGKFGLATGVSLEGRYQPLPHELPITKAPPKLKFPIADSKWVENGKWIKKYQTLLMWIITTLIAIVGCFN